MEPTLARWNLRGVAAHRLGLHRPFSRRKRKHVLLVVERDPICRAQVFPFFHLRDRLADAYGLEFRELPLASFRAGKHPYRGTADAVCFQTWFDVGPDELRRLVEGLHEAFPGAPLAYLDWFAPTDLRYAEALAPHVAVYAKKHLLADRSRYGQATLGDTNLTDHYARRFGLDEPTRRIRVPPAFWDKLLLTPHFAFSAQIMPRLLRPLPAARRDIDLHARIAVSGTTWYRAMRQEAEDRVTSLESRVKIAHRGRIGRSAYLDELDRSKICFSPFGYGEVCWRDFEAIAAGSLLLKPDMGHLQCYPDAYRPGETYVPLAWDLSDLEEKVLEYLRDDAARERITRGAHEHLREWLRRAPFVEDSRRLWTALGLVG